jgi:hypothetical protein
MLRRPVIGTKSSSATTVSISSIKAATVFKTGSLPRVDPDNPTFRLALGDFVINVTVSAKAARKLAAHSGGAVLQGKLVTENGRLRLTEAGFQFFEKQEESSTGSSAPTDSSPPGGQKG